MATRKNLRRTSGKTNRKTGRKGRPSTRKNMKKGGIKILGIKFGPSMKKKNNSTTTNPDTFSFVDIGMGQQESFKHTNYKSDAKDNMYKAMSFKPDPLKSKTKRTSKR